MRSLAVKRRDDGHLKTWTKQRGSRTGAGAPILLRMIEMREATAKARLRASFALYRLAQHPANKYGLIAAGAVPAAMAKGGGAQT